jgi:hypothetical protein
MENKMLCDAWLEGPKGKTRCHAPAPFELVRMASDSNLYLCPVHVGPVLEHAPDLPWPPTILWTGQGEIPPNGLHWREVQRREEAYWEEIQESTMYPDMGPPS